MYTSVYLRVEQDLDSTIMTVYTFVKYHPGFTGNIYLITKQPVEEIVEILASIYSKCEFLKPGLECKQMMLNNKNIADITGKIFKKPTNDFSISHTPLAPTKLAIVCYVYYPEYFQQMYNYVCKLSDTLSETIDMYVYICDINSINDANRILANSTNNNVNIVLQWTQNRGRDVRSFLDFINKGLYKQYDMICKIHTKKTTYLHDNWREEYLKQLLEPVHYEKHKQQLHDTNKGICSVDMFKIQERHVLQNQNYNQLNVLNSIIELDLIHTKVYNFYAGTMFWCTASFCENIHNSIDLSQHNELFEQEPIKNDGTLAHAWERAFWLL